jgi:hypothetical protein
VVIGMQSAYVGTGWIFRPPGSGQDNGVAQMYFCWQVSDLGDPVCRGLQVRLISGSLNSWWAWDWKIVLAITKLELYELVQGNTFYTVNPEE